MQRRKRANCLLTCHQFVTKMLRNMLSMRNMQSYFGVPKLLSFP
jgi:hypothetical protein